LRLVLIDIRDHGQSSKPERCSSRIDFADDVKMLLEVVHIQTADIIGHLRGSVIAQTFAECWPARSGSLVLLSSTALPFKKPTPKAGASQRPTFDFRSQVTKLTWTCRAACRN
jgi:pimeloyl-ACP methyl ester carboxylesterase